ncbi:MAG: response regulator [Lachnospiraceae bacterium]|nr:response regulator [Lachnospiraceae bacterium]
MIRFLKENINTSRDELSIFREYIAYLAHEIKTPLNSIYGNLEILKMEVCPDNRYLDNALLSTEYLINLVNSTLTIAEIENDTNVIKTEAVTLEELFKYPEVMLELAAVKKKIKLQFIFGETVYRYVYLNKAAIQQVIINLVSNAIKYTNEGGTVLCHITQEYLEEKRIKLFLKVEDTGIGMEKEFVLNVWDEFTREGRKEDAKGTGLGMSVTKRLIELLNGTIEIETNTGNGTGVFIELEVDADDIIYDPENPIEEEPDKEKIYQDIKGSSLPKRALVAEDEEAGMNIICKYLDMLGIEVVKAYDGDEVIETFNKSEINFYDVILMDINLPGKNGMDAVREIRKMNRVDKELPIIAITADDFERHRVDMMSGEITGYIIKPYCLKDISSALLNIRSDPFLGIIRRRI